MRKLIVFTIMISIFLTGCESFASRPHAYVEDFEVQGTVTNVDTHHWYAAYAHHYRISVTVYCESLNLSDTIEKRYRACGLMIQYGD